MRRIAWLSSFVFVAALLVEAPQLMGQGTAPPWTQDGWEEAPSEPAPAGSAETAPAAPAPAPAAPAVTPPAAVGPGSGTLFGRTTQPLFTEALYPAGRDAAAPAALHLRSDGARLVIADNGTDPPRMRVLAPYPTGKVGELGYILGHLSPVRALQLSEDHALLASVGGAGAADGERTLRLWNARAMNRRTPGLPLGEGVPTALAISPDGKFIAVGDDAGMIHLFRNRHGRQRPRTARAHSGAVGALAFSRNSRTLFSGAAGSPEVKSWKASEPRRGKTVKTPAKRGVSFLSTEAYAPDGDGGLTVGDRAGGVHRVAGRGGSSWSAAVVGAVHRVRPVPREGVLLVASADSGAVAVLDASTGAVKAPFAGSHGAGLADVAVDLETGLITLLHVDGVAEFHRLDGAPKPKIYR